MLFEPYVRFQKISSGNWVTACWEIAAHLVYDMLSKYKYLIVNLAFCRLCFWSGNCFLMVPFPDHCLIVLFLNLMDTSYLFKSLP